MADSATPLSDHLKWSPFLWRRRPELSAQFKSYSLPREIDQLKLIYVVIGIFSIVNVMIDVVSGEPHLLLFNGFILLLAIAGNWHMRRATRPREISLNVNILAGAAMLAATMIKTTIPDTDWSSMIIDVLIIMVITVALPLNLFVKGAYALILITLDTLMMMRVPEFYATSKLVSVTAAMVTVAAFSQVVAYKGEQTHFQAFMRLKSIRVLSGLLPICANCKKIRDDQGYYQQIEHYITEHSEAEFTHGICPDCARRLYPETDLSDS